MRRIALTLTLLSLAFAPAPFPRPQRRGNDPGVNEQRVQGEWKTVILETFTPDGRKQKHEWPVAMVRIKGRRWTSFNGGGQFLANHYTTLDTSTRPTSLDWYRGDQGGNQAEPSPAWVGLIRLSGDTMQVIYIHGPRERRPTFEKPPRDGMLMTLRRVR
jgi:uncharacterized protein (TIGR03067 family)